MRLVALSLVGLVVAGCKSPPGEGAPPAASSRPSAEPPKSAAPVATASAPATAPSGSAAPAASSSSKRPDGKPPARASLDKLTLEPKAHDIATGSFVALSQLGAIIRRKDDELLLVRLTDKPTVVDADGKHFSRTRTLVIDRGEGSAVYWVSEGKLLRRLLDREGKVSALETLATDAEDGFAPHGARNEGGGVAAPQDVIAYVAHKKGPDGDRKARLWVENKGSLDLSAESGASSVYVAPIEPGRFAAVWLDARSAFAPVHTAPIELDGAGEPRVGAESVAWFAPPSDLLSQVSAAKVDGSLVALLAIPKNGIDFGLAGVPFVFGGKPVPEPSWLDFPNGLDPAPVLPSRFCGLPLVTYVRPTDKPSQAPKAVEIGRLDTQGHVAPGVEVSREGRVDHLAAWVSAKGDGMVAWVGDGRTKVRRVKCGK